MEVLECGTCGHIEFGEAPERCLVCHSAKDVFKANAGAIKRPIDPGELTEAERKHIPVVTLARSGTAAAPSLTVQVTVGEIEHVMQEKHFIRYLDFYVGHKFASRVWLSYNLCRPMATLTLAAASATVQVIENCNLHGNWLTEATI